MTRMTCVVLAALALAPVAAPAHAAGCAPVVRDAWLRMPPVPMPMLAGFARIENPCRTRAVVVGARSPAFDDVSLHETRREQGLSRMRAVTALPVPARGAVALQPGGLHLMAMRPAAEVAVGARVPVTLRLQDGRTVRAVFEVRAATAR